MATENGIGASAKRKEDARFITGAGRYTDDINASGQTYAAFARSPHPRAKIVGLDSSAAEATEGVVAVFTGADLQADGIGDLPCGWMVKSKDGSDMVQPPHPPLAVERVNYVGEPYAVVIGETLAAAKNGVEALAVDFEELPAVVDLASAASADRIHDAAPNNQCYDWELGDKAATEAAFANAHHVTSLDIVNNRLIPNALEPRAALGEYDAAAGSYTLHTTSQNPHLERLVLAAFVNVAPEAKLRVISPDVGGGFGSKIFVYAEETAVIWAAAKVRRPVKWRAERSESFLADAHGRDHVTHAELALAEDGEFLGLRVKTIANMGAYLSTFASSVPTYLYGTLLAGQYKTPAIYVEVQSLFTNTVSVDAYRGAGRPEATYVVERLVETAARDLGMDPADIRRRNFIQPGDFPYQTPVALTYDTGDYEASLDKALAHADYAGFQARKAASEESGKKRGIGLSCYIEACGLAPSQVAISLGAGVGLFEVGEVRVDVTGSVTVVTGSHSHGQSHETTFAQIIAEKLGVPFENVTVLHGDTGRSDYALGTYGSRSLAVGGSAIVKATDKIIAKGKKIAAHMLEAAEDQVTFDDGNFNVADSQPIADLRGSGIRGLRAGQLPAGRVGAWAFREGILRSAELHLSGRGAHLRSGDRPRHGRRTHREVRRGRRFRPHRESDDRRRPSSRRFGARHWPSAAGARRLRRNRAAPERLVHGLHHAARRRSAQLHGGHHDHALHPQPAGRERLRRGRRHRLHGGGDQRGYKRLGRGRCADAGDAGDHLANRCAAVIGEIAMYTFNYHKPATLAEAAE